MAKQMIVASKAPGLKAMSAHRRFAAKGYIPTDTDGAYRVEGRRDGVSARDVLKLAQERKGGQS